MIQKNVRIGDVIVPVIEDEGTEYFPVSYITSKILLRSGKNSLLSSHNRNKLHEHIRKYIVEFGGKNIQSAICISKDGMKQLLLKSKVGSLSVQQRISQNKLHKLLEIPLLPIDDTDCKEFNEDWLKKYDRETEEIVLNEIAILDENYFRRCSKCYIHYPMTNRFFSIDERANKGFSKICHICSGKSESFKFQDMNNKDLCRVSNERLKFVKDKSVLNIYNECLNGNIYVMPDEYVTKEDYTTIIRLLYDQGKINKNNLTEKLLRVNYKLKDFNKFFNIDDVYESLFGKEFYLEVWKYPNYTFKNIKLSYEIANKIVDNYIKEHGITMDNIFEYDYDDLFRKCRIRKLTNSDIKYFVVQYYQFKYAGYKFNISSNNYYNDVENVLFDLKYLIEQDMKIQIEKIPLYLTKTNLRKKCNSLYYYIITKKNKSIYEWVNTLYPNKFTEADFELNPYRNKFDSDSEMYIHEILESEFPNQVIYNQRNNGDIRLKGKVPDWFIFTDQGVWIVEYFGMLEKRKTDNDRLEHYRDRYEDKMNSYKELNGYKFLYLYREDIVDDFKGCRDKIRKVKESIAIVRV